MQDSSHLTIILCSSVIIIVVSHKQKVKIIINNCRAVGWWRVKIIIHVFQENNKKTLQDCT
jgi:sRNA-binding carbon storage regulator CsrA